MLYCPKCQQTYEETAQRFCLKDGARLLPAGSSGKSANQTNGVFAKILNRNLQAGETEGSSANSYPAFSPPAGKMFKAEEDILSLPEINAPQKPQPRIIKPNEVPASQATLGDRKINPTGRPALSWENPNVLLQQTIKNRYLIAKKIDWDENSIAYVAEDKLVPNKKVMVRILMEQDASDKFTNKIFAEERVSLSHVKHPGIACVIDSGELLEGNPFVITEYVEGTSVKDMLNRKGEFNALRTARIVRQVSYALSEVHQHGVLHRNLKAENIILTLNDDGVEQVKLINFGVPNVKINKENLGYKSPEQLEGNVATFASDIYSLAIIAYQMLTGRLPFNSSSANALLKSQREGMTTQPTNLRLDLPPITNSIFEKALAFSPSQRYPKARDFGDAFYNALNAAVISEKEEKQQESEKIEMLPNQKIEENVRKAIYQPEETLLPDLPPAPLASNKNEVFELDILSLDDDSVTYPVVSDKTIEPPMEAKNFVESKREDFAEHKIETPDAIETPIEIEAESKIETPIEIETESEIETTTEVEAPKDLAWEKRSLEPTKTAGSSKTLFLFLGTAILLAGVFALWFYALNRPNNAPVPEPVLENVPVLENANVSAANTETAPVENFIAEVKTSPALENIEIPPSARNVSQPPNTVFFETSKQNLKGDLLRNFVGFSLYYPKDWVKNNAANNFIDVAKKTADGKPIEQFLVSYYDSNGTFNMDEDNFPKLAEKSNKDLAKIIPNYQTMSSGEIKVNGEWRAFEVKFQGGGKVEKGEKKLAVWGRRIWIPAARPGSKNGFVVTMLATSLSPEITSVNDVGLKGDLGTLFGTFEPNQNF